MNYIMTIYFSEGRDSTDTVHISHKSLCVFLCVCVCLSVSSSVSEISL